MLPKELSDFLATLSKTIDKDVLVFVDLYALSDAPGLEADYLGRLVGQLPDTAALPVFIASLRIIGAMDYVLNRAASVGHRPQIPMPTDPAMAEIATLIQAMAPLREKHFADALIRWKTLRATALSDGALREFETLCLDPGGRD